MAPSPTLCLMCLWLPLLVTGVMAGPRRTDAPLRLDVTSGRLLGHPVFGDTLGPYTAGQDLTLTCHTRDPSVTLTWSEGEKELPSRPERSLGMASATLTLETLSVSDSGRQLSCRAVGTDVVKTVTLDVAANIDILVDGKILRKLDSTVTIHSGATVKLNCVSQGYVLSPLSWFEGDTELGAHSEKSSYAASSVLALTAVSAADSGRHFSCRSEDGAHERVVKILVYEDDAIDVINDAENSELTMRIILIVVCCIGMVLILVLAVAIVRLVEVYNATNRTKKLVRFSELFKKHTLLSLSKIPPCDSKAPSPSYTLI